jgi:FtsP/CotA-like multicopper oxidase with cupredoxin domain
MPPSASILSRRNFLTNASAGALVACLGSRSGAQEAAETTSDGFRLLRARAASAGPGPLLRVKRGEELRLRLINELPDATAIHWHGVRAPNLMDGAPGLTPTAVAPGAGFDYRFRPPDAGTFWYHAPGFAGFAPRLYGALIVEEAEPPEIDREHVLVLDARPILPQGEPQGSDAAGELQILANGTPAPDLAVRANERLRLRLINATAARVIALRLDRHVATVMAFDGQPAEPFRARDSRIVLGPGNTADLFVDATLEPSAVAPILLADTDTPLARLVYDDASAIRAAVRPPPRPLPANPLPERLDFSHAMRLDWQIDDRLGGSHALGQQPAAFRVKRGRTVMLGLSNRQAYVCAVHLHGHAFRLLDRLDDGWKPFWLATVLVEAGQTTRIAFQADNPGKWPITCAGIGRPQVTAGWFEVA